MAKPKKIQRETFLLRLPVELMAKVKLMLYSELEGRVPYGAQQEFFERLVREKLEGGKSED